MKQARKFAEIEPVQFPWMMISLFTSFFIGFGIYSGFPLLILAWLPVQITMTHFLARSDSASSSSPFLVAFARSFLLGLTFHLGVMGPWLPHAVTNSTGTSGMTSALLASIVMSYHALQYSFFSTMFLLPHSWNNSWRWAVGALMFAAVNVGLPNLLGMSIGELLGAHSLFWPALTMIGSMGLTLLVACLQTSFVVTLLEKSTLQRWMINSALVLVLIIASVLGQDKAQEILGRTQPTTDLRPPTRFAMIQTSWNPDSSLDTPAVFQKNLAQILEESWNKTESSFDVFVTPEGGVPGFPLLPLSERQQERYQSLSPLEIRNQMAKKDFWWLGVFPHVVDQSQTLPSNSLEVPAQIQTAFLLNPQFQLADTIPKANLIPFIEAIPSWMDFAVTRYLFPWATARNSASDRSFVVIKDLRIGIQICYDSLFRKSFQEFARAGVQAIFTLSNHTAFKEGGAWFHYAVTLNRQFEYGIPVYFLGNTGYSGWLGSSHAAWGTQQLEVASLTPRVPTPTFYMRNVAFWLEPMMSVLAIVCFLFTILVFISQTIRFRTRLLHQALQFSRRDFVRGGFAAILAMGALNLWGVRWTQIPSPSMAPQFLPGDRTLLCLWKKEPLIGDIVSFVDRETGLQIIKRVFLGPNDSYEFKDGKALINGHEIQARTLKENQWSVQFPMQSAVIIQGDELWPKMNLQMASDEYFVLGDNRAHSMDSRKFGPIRARQLIGTACL